VLGAMSLSHKSICAELLDTPRAKVCPQESGSVTWLVARTRVSEKNGIDVTVLAPNVKISWLDSGKPVVNPKRDALTCSS